MNSHLNDEAKDSDSDITKETLLNEIIENATQPIGLGFPDGSLKAINQAFSKLVGYTHEELQSIKWDKDLTPEKWRDQEKEFLEKATIEKKPTTYEKEYVRKDGTVIPIELTVHPYFKNNKLTYYFAFVKDISDKKSVESKFLNKEKELNQIFLAIPDALIFFNKNDQIEKVNSSFLKMFGYQEEEVLGLTPEFLLQDQHKYENLKKEGSQLNDKGEFPKIKMDFVRKKGEIFNGEIKQIIISDHENNELGHLCIISDITESDRYRNRIKRAEKIALIGYWELNVKTGIVRVSEGAKSIYGYEKEGLNIRLEKIKSFPLPEYRKKLDKALNNLIYKNKSYKIEFKIKKGNSKEIRDIYSIAQYDSQRKMVFGIIQDITNSNYEKRKIVENEEKLKAIFNSIDASIVTFETTDNGASFKVKDVNQKVLDFLPENVLSEINSIPLSKLAQKTQNFDIEDLLLKVYKTGKAQTFKDIWFEDEQSGKTIWFDSQLYRLSTGEVVGIFVDTTEKINTYQQLEKSKNQFEKLVDLNPVPMLVGDYDKNILRLNVKFTEEFGYSLKDISTIEEWWKKAYREKEYRKKAEEKWDELIEKTKLNKNIRSDNHIWEIVCNNGQKKTVNYHLAFLENFYIVSAIDISDSIDYQQTLEQKNREIELHNEKLASLNNEYSLMVQEYQRMNKELNKSINQIKQINRELDAAKIKAEESDHLKSAFLANMSHEIRTPMNAIIGFANLLKKPDLPIHKRIKFNQVIEDNGKQLLNIVNDILDISKIETGQITIQMEPVDINMLLEELRLQFDSKSREKNINLNILKSLNGAEAVIESDPYRLKQILGNLIDNAIKFTKKGTINIGYIDVDDNLEFFVQDSGIGISKSSQALIFERFRQAHKETEEFYGGTGLGLAITKALVELFGGKIWLKSAPGKGTTFYFTIPHKIMRRTGRLNEESAPAELSKLKNINVLIAEDSDPGYYYLKEILEGHVHDVVRAYNGQEAVEIIKSGANINLVLMDVKLPILNGYLATKEIKNHTPDIPVIVQTAYAMPDDRNEAFAHGCDDYISKPIDRKLLFESILSFF